MSLVVSDIGEVKMLNVILGKQAAESLIYKLYTNDYTPAAAYGVGGAGGAGSVNAYTVSA